MQKLSLPIPFNDLEPTNLRFVELQKPDPELRDHALIHIREYPEVKPYLFFFHT